MPAWLAAKHPEVLRVNADRKNSVWSPSQPLLYFTCIPGKPASSIRNLPNAIRITRHLVWHVSNEYGGECHCELCQEAFREWLKQKYDGDLDKLNHAWWTAFWSHTYTDWSQIQSPAPHGETSIHGLNLDWKRFVTHQTIEFFKNEIAPLKEITPDVPVTATHGLYPASPEICKEVDVVSWTTILHGMDGNLTGLASKIGLFTT